MNEGRAFSTSWRGDQDARVCQGQAQLLEGMDSLLLPIQQPASKEK
jgi:hypothetical protein